jgi:hypothetical protein
MWSEQAEILGIAWWREKVEGRLYSPTTTTSVLTGEVQSKTEAGKT